MEMYEWISIDISLKFVPKGQTNNIPGPRFTNGFSVAIKIRWKFRFTLISILIQWLLQILYMARELCCQGMCKNFLRFDGQ